MKKELMLGFFAIGSVFSAGAQTENCSDGIDNNGNNLIDCFDPICACECEDKDYYYTEPVLSSNECKPDCEFFPETDVFALTDKFSNPTPADWYSYSSAMVGDVDGDGINEAVGIGVNPNSSRGNDQWYNSDVYDRITIADLSDGGNDDVSIIPTPSFKWMAHGVTLAQLDDGNPEIIVMAAAGTNNGGATPLSRGTSKRFLLRMNHRYIIPIDQLIPDGLPNHPPTILPPSLNENDTTDANGVNIGKAINAGGRIFCYEFVDPDGPNGANGINLTRGYYLKWVSDRDATHDPDGTANAASPNADWGNQDSQDAVTISVADFDNDGTPELYCQNRIFSNRGVFIAGAPETQDFGSARFLDGVIASYSIAVDVLGDKELELVAGGTVYDVDLSVPSVTPIKQLSNTNPGVAVDGYTSVADMNKDGNLDAVVTGINSSNTAFLYIWDLTNETLLGSYDFATDAVPTQTSQFISQATIGNFVNDDAALEIAVTTSRNIQVLNYDPLTSTIVQQWVQSNSDASGRTGSTSYDFNGDGQTELVYRDETNLYVYDGQQGNTPLASIPCASTTGHEYPVIVDADQDGFTDIVCGCGNLPTPQLMVFHSSNTPWVPTRTVWNQHNYFSTNVEEDLSIPAFQQRHDLIGNTDPTSKYYNSGNFFLSQIPQLDGKAPDGELILTATCDENANQVNVTLKITNHGDANLDENTPIAIYDGVADYGNLISDIVIGKRLAPDESIEIEINSLSLINGGLITAMLNDDGEQIQDENGSNVLWSIDNFPVTRYGECDYSNNKSFATPPCFGICEEMQNLDLDHLIVFSQDVTININTVWDHKIFINDGVIVTIDGAILDVTNVDVIFGECAGIDFVNGSILRSTNSVYRPCRIDDAWRGLRFDENSTPTGGMINECTFKNAVVAVNVESNALATQTELRITNNLFSNCLRGLNCVNVIMEKGISGNTFQLDDDHPDFDVVCNTFGGFHTGVFGTDSDFNDEISQNDFINNDIDSRYFGVGLIRANSGNVTRNDFVNNSRAIASNGSSFIEFEGNMITLSNADVRIQDQAGFFNSNDIRIINNHFYNSYPNNSTILGNGATGNSAISIFNGNIVNCKENEIYGFETGIETFDLLNSNIGENSIKNAWYYGIYSRNPENVDVACNLIDMELSNDRNTIGIGMFYNALKAPALNDRNQIRSNCVYETQSAIHVEGTGSGIGSTSPDIINNFLFNYVDFGVNFVNVDASSALGTGLTQENSGKNTFQSNNIPEGAVDVSSTGSSLGTTIYGCYGVSSIFGPVGVIGGSLYNSTASCGNQLGSVNAGISNDEVCDNIEGVEFRYALVNMPSSSSINQDEPNLQASNVEVSNPVLLKKSFIKMYPNPVENFFTLELNSEIGDYTSVEIFSIDGKMLKKIENSGQNLKLDINIESLSSGIYVVKVMDAEKLIDQAKLIKK